MNPFARRPVLENSIFDMFRGGGGGQQQQQTGTPNPGNIPASGQSNQNQNQNSNANVNDPNSSANSGAPNNNDPNKNQPAENRSPLAEFAGLWDSPPAPKDGEAVQPDWNDHSSIVPEMNVDPKRLIESARRIDFSKVMNPERVQAALKGDAGAFNEVINSVAQAAFANMAMSTTKIVKAMSAQMAEKLYSGALPHHFRKHAVNTQIDTDLPILSDPAVAPMFESFKQQLQVKYPKASAKEISDKAKNMVMSFAEAVKGGSSKPNDGASKGGLNKTGAQNEDWTDFFTQQ